MKTDYFEFRFTRIPEEMKEILMAELSELGFESFQEEQDFISGYIPVSLYKKTRILSYLAKRCESYSLTYEKIRIQEENWNAIWEANFTPVLLQGKCLIRAPFHDPIPDMEYDIVIEPRMSFGTGHHETTSLMLEMLMKEDVKGKRVLDIGCGTGVLAILAFKMGAVSVEAVDMDEWAFQNASDNVRKNNASSVTVIHGDVRNIPSHEYDVILANINRNVLLEDIPAYSQHLPYSGILMVSGFYLEDLTMIRNFAKTNNLKFQFSESRNNWTAAKFVK